MDVKLLVEETRIQPPPKAGGFPLGHGLAEFGLDPDLYIAALPADLGMAGVVNRNDRIYPPAEFVRENRRLNLRAQQKFVPSEANHPEGAPTLSVAARVMRVELTDVAGKPLAESTGDDALPQVVVARGVLAFLNTTQGRDLWTLYSAGMDLGTSSRAWGVERVHLLDASSPYALANAAHIGRKIGEVQSFDLVTYDVVVDPSAATFVQRMTTEQRQALDRLGEALSWHRSPPPAAKPPESLNEKDNGGPRMDITKLRAEHPALVAEIEQKAGEKALAENETLRRLGGLSPAKVSAILALVGSLPEGATPTSVDNLLASVDERVKLATRELAERASLTEKALGEAQRKLAEADAREAERERLTRLGAVLAEKAGALHSAFREDVRALVAEDVASGRVKDEASVIAAIDRYAAPLKRLAEAAPAAQVPPPPKAPDPAPGPAAVPEDEALRLVLGEQWSAKLKAALGK